MRRSDARLQNPPPPAPMSVPVSVPVSFFQSPLRRFSEATPPPGFFTVWRAAPRFVLLCLWFAGGLVYGSVLYLVLRRPFYGVCRFFQRVALWLAGIRVELAGAPPLSGAGLIVSNHQSYWDITVLGVLAPGRFIARGDMEHWPVLGLFAKFHGSFFFQRRAGASRAQIQHLQAHLGQTQTVPWLLFPEGTTSDGCRVLPFKSSLFEAFAQKPDLLVQTVALSYTHRDGTRLSPFFRSFFAWQGRRSLLVHVWEFLKFKPLRVRVVCSKPQPLAAWGSCRKTIAKTLENAVRESFHQNETPDESPDKTPDKTPGEPPVLPTLSPVSLDQKTARHDLA